MNIQPIKTRKLLPPQDDLLSVIRETIKEIPERSILAITSKVVSIWKGRTMKTSEIDKDELIKKSARKFLDRSEVPERHVMHTITNNVLIGSAGIDESNSNGYYTLWPEKPKLVAKEIYDWLRKEYGVSQFGVIISDSRSIPMRRGAIGFALAFWGFNPLLDYVDKADLFNRLFKAEKANLADGLAAAAVVAMGEGAEQTPMAIISDLSKIEFSDKEVSQKKSEDAWEINFENDIFYPFLNRAPWQEGGGEIGD